MDRISVVVPTFNAAGTLLRCLRSLLDQTAPLHEIIVVDDGSTDQSAFIADCLADDHPRIRVLRQPNAGVSAARNTGLELATGEFIGFVDPDDSVDPTMYKRMLHRAMEHELPMVGLSDATIHSAQPVTEGEAEPDGSIPATAAIAGLLTLNYPTSVWAHLYSRDVIGDTRFDPRIGFFEDLLFNFEILRGVDRVGLIAGELYHYRPSVGGANLSALSEKHLSSILVCTRVREALVRDSLPLWRELATLESECLRMMVYKAAVAESRHRDLEVRIRPFARTIVPGVWMAGGVGTPTKALVIAASVSAGAVVGLARLAFKLKRRLRPIEGRNR